MIQKDEAPSQYFLSKILRIPMNELWTVLFDYNLARKKGDQKNIVQQNIEYFIAVHGITKVIDVNTKEIIMVIRVVFYSLTNSAINDDNPTSQWKMEKRPPRPIQEVARKFRDEMKKFHEETTKQQQNNTRINLHNGLNSSIRIDCIEIEIYIFLVINAMIGLTNRLLKDMIDYTDLVLEDTQEVQKYAR